MMRVQIPAYTDRWMMGDRFGTVLRITHRPIAKVSTRAALLTSAQVVDGQLEIAHVELDKSHKVVRVILQDCQVI